jgi:hypothetical protein
MLLLRNGKTRHHSGLFLVRRVFGNFASEAQFGFF